MALGSQQWYLATVVIWLPLSSRWAQHGLKKKSAAIIALHDKRNCAACKTKCSLGYCGQTMAGETCRWLSLLFVAVGRWDQVFDSWPSIHASDDSPWHYVTVRVFLTKFPFWFTTKHSRYPRCLFHHASLGDSFPFSFHCVFFVRNLVQCKYKWLPNRLIAGSESALTANTFADIFNSMKCKLNYTCP